MYKYDVVVKPCPVLPIMLMKSFLGICDWKITLDGHITIRADEEHWTRVQSCYTAPERINVEPTPCLPRVHVYNYKEIIINVHAMNKN